MKDEQNKNNLGGVIYTDEDSQDSQPESSDYSSSLKLSGLFGSGDSSEKKKNIRNILIIVVCVALTYFILSSYYSKKSAVKEEVTPEMKEEMLEGI